LAYARAFARVREVFGRPLHTWPAHRATLATLAVDHAAALSLTIRCCELMGKVEHGSATEDEVALLRGLTPLTKLATAKWAVASAAEVMESIGGVGYCEDSGIPALVRNTHVLPIWEGTTNVLSLDFLRAVHRSDALEAISADINRTFEKLDSQEAGDARTGVVKALGELTSDARSALEDERMQSHARRIALGLARTYACTRLSAQGEWAAKHGSAATSTAARVMSDQGLVPPRPPADADLAMDEEVSAEQA
jgi:hypothetical protein